jgi:hypothetical protein
MSKPITGIDCCTGAAIGHVAAAPPRRVRKERRSMKCIGDLPRKRPRTPVEPEQDYHAKTPAYVT